MSDTITEKDLTQGERFFIWRRRKHWNQIQAARHFGVSYDAYSMTERGIKSFITINHIGELEQHEKCVIYRRRTKTTQAKIASDLKVCRWWVNMMENGKRDCHMLIDYWEQ